MNARLSVCQSYWFINSGKHCEKKKSCSGLTVSQNFEKGVSSLQNNDDATLKHWLNIESKLVRLVGMKFQGLKETIPIPFETHENKSMKSFVSKTFKETYEGHFQLHSFIWNAARGGFHALMLQKSIHFHSVQGCIAVSLLCLKHPCFLLSL